MAERRGTVPPWLDIAAAWAWRLLLLAVAMLAVLAVLGRIYLVVFPVIIALFLATLLEPPARLLRRVGAPPALAALAVVVSALLLFVGGMTLLVPEIVDEFGEMGEVLAEGYQEALRWLETTFGVSEEQVTEAVDQAGEWLRQNVGQIGAGILLGVVLVVEVLAGLVLSLVLAFFFIKDSDRITGWILERTRPEWRDDLAAAARRGWVTLGGYIRGTAIIATVDAVGIGLGVLVIGVPLVLPITALTFIGGFFPIVGAFTAGLFAVLVALVTLGFIEALLVLGVVIAVQQLESNVLEPFVLSKNIPLHPVVILVTITAGAVLAGIAGAFLAVPAAAVVSAVGNELRVRREGAQEPGASEAPTT